MQNELATVLDESLNLSEGNVGFTLLELGTLDSTLPNLIVHTHANHTELTPYGNPFD